MLRDIDYMGRRTGDRWMRIKETRTSDGGRIGVRIDITDLKRSEESFRLLLEKNPLPMWVYDHESLRFLAVNDAAIAHYGYSKDEFLAMTILDIRPAEDRQKMRELVGTGGEGTYQSRPASGAISRPTARRSKSRSMRNTFRSKVVRHRWSPPST